MLGGAGCIHVEFVPAGCGSPSGGANWRFLAANDWEPENPADFRLEGKMRAPKQRRESSVCVKYAFLA